ncbi:MAG: DUF4430 domain-containing protein, partial [Bacteroidales bacterium]|nr:DUF4430 domain-containing protein [Bacteroidales bacterium]
MQKKKNRLLAILLTVVMVFGLMPVSVLAEDDVTYSGSGSYNSGGGYIDSDTPASPETESSEVESSDTESSETKPSEADSSEMEPSEDPSDTEPSETESSETESSETEPAEMEPESEYPDPEELPELEGYPEPEEHIGFELYNLAPIPFGTGDEITVYMSFEGYTIGHGFFIEPIPVTIPAGSSLEVPTRLLLDNHGYTYNASGTGGTDFGISRINGLNANSANVPAFIQNGIMNSTWGMLWDMFTPVGQSDGSLGNGDFFLFSGWMYTVNHEMPGINPNGTGDGLAAGSVIPNDGDVIRWQFTLIAGPDLGFAMQGMGPAIYEHADKSDLIRAMFAEGANVEARPAALDVIINPRATAE